MYHATAKNPWTQLRFWSWRYKKTGSSNTSTRQGVMWSLRITDSTGPDLIVNSKSCSWLEEWTIQWIFIHNFNQPLYRSLMMLMSKLLMKQNLRSHSCFFETCNPGNTAFLCGEKPDALNKFRLTHGIWQQPCQAPKLHWADWGVSTIEDTDVQQPLKVWKGDQWWLRRVKEIMAIVELTKGWMTHSSIVAREPGFHVSKHSIWRGRHWTPAVQDWQLSKPFPV